MSSTEKPAEVDRVIAVPVAEGRVAMHFGHCQEFALFDVDGKAQKVLNDRRLEPPGHQPGVLPQWLRDQGVNLVIAGGIGSRAQGIFASYGIEVIAGAPPEPPEAVVQSFLEGRLEAGQNICDH